MNYRFDTNNGYISAVPVDANGADLDTRSKWESIAQISEEERIKELDTQFRQWATENGVQLKIDTLPPWAVEGLQDIPLIRVQNEEPQTLLSWILQYHGIIGYDTVITETVLALFGGKENN